MKNIIAFGASNSSTSINKQLATYASTLVENANTEVLDLNDFDVPTYSIDIEKQSGVPENAKQFFNKIGASDGVIISLAEHNGAYTAAFKSLFDWMSRIDVKLFQDKPMLLMSTAPGPRGGLSVFEMAEGRFHRHDAKIVAKFRLPSFNENFEDGKITNQELNDLITEAVTIFKDSI